MPVTLRRRDGQGCFLRVQPSAEADFLDGMVLSGEKLRLVSWDVHGGAFVRVTRDEDAKRIEPDLANDQVVATIFDPSRTGSLRAEHVCIVVGRFLYSILTDATWHDGPWMISLRDHRIGVNHSWAGAWNPTLAEIDAMHMDRRTAAEGARVIRQVVCTIVVCHVGRPFNR